jgi:GNAT superfamily N-acetyltransferase
MEFRRLEASDDLTGFSCGDSDIDDRFRNFALQNQNRGLSSTHVAVDAGRVVGFATLYCYGVEASEFPKNLVRGLPYRLPVLVLGQLGVGTDHQGQKIGTRLVLRVIPEALKQAETAGCFGMVVDALPDREGFYQRFGFQGFGATPTGAVRMLLPTTAIRQGVPPQLADTD